MRGLVAAKAAKAGDVLLEVPLSCCLSDFGSDPTAVYGAALPPAYSASLPWNVQLACSVLAARSAADGCFAPFLASWPEPPPLPMSCEPEELALACDKGLELRADEVSFLVEELN